MDVLNMKSQFYSAALFFLLAATLASCSNKQYSGTELVIPGINQNTEAKFLEEKERILNQSPDADFDALRQAYVGTDDFKPWDSSEHKAGLVLLEAQADGNLELCITFARAMIKENFTSLLGHFGVASCGKALGYTEEASFHSYVLQGLIDSIRKSGDGLSPETAYVCNSPTEMRDFVRLSGLLMYRQEYHSAGRKQIEAVFAMDTQTDEALTLYFDTTASRMHSFKP